MSSEFFEITSGDVRLTARLERALAPATCAAFCDMLPLDTRLIHVRWSGEGVWLPFGERVFELPWENPTRHPAPGEMIFYPGGYSEAEILLAYGSVAFASKLGPLAGNHFLTVVEGLDRLRDLGRKILWEGAQEVSFRCL